MAKGWAVTSDLARIARPRRGLRISLALRNLIRPVSRAVVVRQNVVPEGFIDVSDPARQPLFSMLRLVAMSMRVFASAFRSRRDLLLENMVCAAEPHIRNC